MSLINDALKRAKEAQQQAASPLTPGPQLRPAEPLPRARQGLGLTLPVALAALALLLAFMVWQLAQRQSPVRAMTPPPPVPQEKAEATPAAIPGDVAAAAPASVPAPVTVPAPEPASAPVAAASPTPASAQPPPAASQTPVTPNPAPMVEPVAPKPPPLRLQGIVFNPARPSAVINGRTVFIGDRIGEQRVLAIDRESATLAGGGQTNILSLEQ
jgi:hypothetical protein